jgi:imidazolonepropionase-like amidohydrolase
MPSEYRHSLETMYMTKSHRIHYLALAAAILLATLPVLAQGGSYAVTNARIYTVSGQVIENGTVLIRDCKIAAVGKSVSIPGNTKVINARGLEVYPGLIDGGGNIGLTEIGAVPATVDTSEMNDYSPQIFAAAAINPASEHIPVTRLNGITAAVSRPAGGTISGQAALIHLSGWTIDDIAIRKSVGMIFNFPSLRASGGRGGRGRGQSSFTDAKRAFDNKLAEIRNLLNDARSYAKAKEAAAKNSNLPPVERNLKMEALVPVIKGELPLLVDASSNRDIRNAVEFAEKEKLRIILTGAEESWRVADLLKEKKVPVILGPIIAMPVREDDSYDSRFTAPSILFKAGVKFCFATEGSSFARNLPYQAGTAVAYGLPKEEALKALTLNAAEILGVAAELGSIDVGKVADLVVTDGDIMELKTQVKYLFIKGQPVELKSRQTDLADKYMARP